MSSQHEQHTTERQQRFLQLLDPMRPRLSRFAWAMTRDRDEAEDLAAETIAAAWEGFGQLRDESAFPGWLLRIAVRIHRRARRRRKFWGLFSQEHAEQLRDTSTAPDVAAEIRILYEALSRLPERQREAVVLFEVSDLPLEEIQQIQGGTLSGVKSRVVRGRERLAELMTERPATNPERTPASNGTVPENGTATLTIPTAIHR